MKSCPKFFFAALAALGTLSACPSAQAEDDDAKLLQGKWLVVSAKQNGGTFAKDRIEKMLVVVEKDELRVYVEGAKSQQTAKFTLDPKRDPKQIDFKETLDGEWSDQPHLTLFRRYKVSGGKTVSAAGNAEGIYKLEGDSLILCWRTTEGKEIRGGKISSESTLRPSVFRSDLYYYQFLFTLERVKPER